MLSNLFGKKNALCPKANLCSGCEWISQPLATQHKHKQQRQRDLLKEYGIPYEASLTISTCGSKAERIFVDVSFERMDGQTKLGLYDINREHIVNIERCPAAITDLQDCIEALSKDPMPIDRASLRLRVNPHGQWGMWIDAANIDIRTLLNEQQWLRRWMGNVHIEMGQRRKFLQVSNGRLKLEAPLVRPWFQTFTSQSEAPFLLWSVVGGFSQPSEQGVRQLVRALEEAISPFRHLNTWLEYGAGSGTLTVPLSQLVTKVIATESSTVARSALDKALKHHHIENVEISPLNIQRQTDASITLLSQADALLVDPPRSGLGHTLRTLEKVSSKPDIIVYVSCHGRTLCKDGQQLRTMGYTLKHLHGVDQFPNTPHCEWVSVWEYTHNQD